MRDIERAAADAARATAPTQNSYFPFATIKCSGPAVFRSQAARDVGCLLDLDRTVSSWTCQPRGYGMSAQDGTPDFLVVYDDDTQLYLDAPDRTASETAFRFRLDFEYRQLAAEEVYDGYRLQNACDLLRYGKWRTSLGDRVRLLAALDEHGSLSFAECLSVIQETKPVAAVAALIISGLIEVDLDTALLGPETSVRRIRR